jgi:DNA-directed RNA polymerase specialized sigma subunit
MIDLPKKRKRRTKKDSDYISSEELFNEVLRCQAEGRVNNVLGQMFLTLATRYGTKPNFSGYSYLDEMISSGVVACIASLNKFNPEKTTNAFAYYTQVIHTSFLQVLNKEKKHQMIRDKSMVEANLNPSFAYNDLLVDHNEDNATANADQGTS